MDRSQLYSLSFVSGAVSLSTVPEIVLSFPEELMLPFYAYAEKVREASREQVGRYLSNVPGLTFTCGAGKRFGYQGCASVTQYRGSCEIHFELYDFSSRCAVASLNHTLVALNMLFHDMDGIITDIHVPQFLELNTIFGNTLHGHSAGEYIHPQFGTWLARKQECNKSLLRSKVVNAMNEVWTTLTHEKLKKHASQAKLIFMDDGRFVLTCFGDACDIGVYPDYVGNGTPLGAHIVKFGSHNLDNHFQQLTLIAGLAEMVGQAQRDHSLMSLPMCA